MAAQENASRSSGDQGKIPGAKVATVGLRRASRLLPPPSYAAKFSADFWRPAAARQHGGDFVDVTVVGFSAQLTAYQQRHQLKIKRQISKPEVRVPESLRDSGKMVSGLHATLRKGSGRGGGDADLCRRSKIPCPVWYFANNSSVKSAAHKSSAEQSSMKSRKPTGFSRTSDRTLTTSSASSSPPKARDGKDTSTSKVHGPPDHGSVNGRRFTKVLAPESVKRSALVPAACSRPTRHQKKCAASCIQSSTSVSSSLLRVRVHKQASPSKVHGPPHHGIFGHQRATKMCSASAASDKSVICHRLTRFYDKCNASRVPSSTSHVRGTALSSFPKTRGRNDASRGMSSSGSVQVVDLRQPSQESVMTCEHLDVISDDNQLNKFPKLMTLEDLSPSDDDFDCSSSSVDKQPTQEHHVRVYNDDEFETKTSPVTDDDVTLQNGDAERPSVYEETMTSLSRETEQPSAVDEFNVSELCLDTMPSDSDRRSVAQEQQTEASFQMLNDELGLHSAGMRSSSSSTERPHERCCDVNGDDDILNASRDQTLPDCMQALMKKLKTVFTSLWNSVAMKSRYVEQSQGVLTMNKDMNQTDQHSDVNEWADDAATRSESPSSDYSHLSSSSSDGIKTFVRNRFINSGMMSSASGDDWSDNDFEEADEPDAGDMLNTLTEESANTQASFTDCLDLSSSTMTYPCFHGSCPKKMALIEAAIKSVVDAAFGDSESDDCE